MNMCNIKKGYFNKLIQVNIVKNQIFEYKSSNKKIQKLKLFANFLTHAMALSQRSHISLRITVLYISTSLTLLSVCF